MPRHHYLIPYTWLNAGVDSLWFVPHNSVGSIDLRPVPAMARGGLPQGYAFAVYDRLITDPAAIYLGNNLEGILTDAQRSLIKTALGLVTEVSSDRLLDLLWDLLTVHADAKGISFCKPLIPIVDRVLELRLGGYSLIRSEEFDLDHPHWPKVLETIQADYREIRGNALAGRFRDRSGSPDTQYHQRWLSALMRKYRTDNYRQFIPSDLPVEIPLPEGSEISDNFDRPDESLDAGPWAELVNNWKIATNVASTDGGDQGSARHNTALDSADQDSEVDLTAFEFGAGPCARFAATANTHYQCRETSSTNLSFAKTVDGVRTLLSTGQAITQALPDNLRVRVNGSTMQSYFDDVLKHDFTDTAISSGSQAGMNCRGLDDLNNFLASDLAASAVYSGRGVGRGIGRGIGR